MHDSPITTISTSVKSGLLCSGGYDGKVIMFDVNMNQIWEFQALDLINHVSFDSSEKLVAAASADGFVYVFNVYSGHLRARLGPRGDDVNAVAWHPSGQYLAAALDAKDTDRIVIWDVSTCRENGVLDGHEHGVFALAYSPCGNRLVSAAEDGTARVWDIGTGAELLVLSHPGDPETVAWSPCGKFIATGCDDALLRLWDAESGQEIASHLANGAVRFVTFDHSGTLLLNGSYDALVRLHSVPDLSVIKTLSGPFQWERTAAFGPEETIFVGSFGGGPIRHDQHGTAVTGKPTLGINCVAANSNLTLVGRDDGSVLSVDDGVPLYLHDSIVNTVVFAPDKRIASGDYRGCLKLFDLTERTMVAEKVVPGGPINSITFDPQTGTFFTGGYDGIIRAWSKDLSTFIEIGKHHGPIKSLAWCRASSTLIAGSSDDTISGWHNQRRAFDIDHEELVLINAVAAHPTSAEFVSASRDGRLRIWNATTGKLIESLPLIHRKSVKAVAYDSTGDRLVSGAYDGDGVLWTKVDGEWNAQLLELHGKPGVPAVGFRGDSALTAGWNGTVGQWNKSAKLERQFLSRSM